MSDDNYLTQHNKSPEAFRTISEASEEIGIAPHVMRFWEGKFPNLKPLKRAGGRRFYRPQDILLMRGLKHLLQDQGLTIRGVQKLIKERGIQSIRDSGGNDGGPTDYKDFILDDAVEYEALEIATSDENASIAIQIAQPLSGKQYNSSPALLRALARLEQARLILDNASQRI